MFSKEMQSNLDAFEKIKDELERDNFGKYALMHNGKLDSIYNDQHDAYKTACDRFGVGNFALQKIGERPISLGFYTMWVSGG